MLISYPTGAGGRTVTNCLTFSDHATMHTGDATNPTWDMERKWRHVRSEFTRSILLKQWNDLGMNGSDLIGQVMQAGMLRFVEPATLSAHYQQLHWNPLFVDLSHGDRDFMMSCHTRAELRMHQQHWTNSRTIRCVNGDAVINALRGDELPRGLTAQQLRQLVRHEDDTCDRQFTFDMTRLLDTDRFMVGMRTLYQQMGYDDWSRCEHHCERFHSTWLALQQKLTNRRRRDHADDTETTR